MAVSKERVRELYDSMDLDHSKGLTSLEIMKMLKKLEQPYDAASVTDYFDKYNKDGDSVLSFDEFYKAFTLKSNDTLTDDELLKKFKEFDSDNSGLLDVNEVKQLMQKSGRDTKQVEKDMEIMDSKQKDGKISFDEFKALF